MLLDAFEQVGPVAGVADRARGHGLDLADSRGAAEGREHRRGVQGELEALGPDRALLGHPGAHPHRLPDLVDDNTDGLRHLPLRLALRTGAPRLMVVTIVTTVFLVASIVVAGLTVGLRQ